MMMSDVFIIARERALSKALPSGMNGAAFGGRVNESGALPPAYIHCGRQDGRACFQFTIYCRKEVVMKGLLIAAPFVLVAGVLGIATKGNEVGFQYTVKNKFVF